MYLKIGGLMLILAVLGGCGGDGDNGEDQPSGNADLVSMLIAGAVLDPAFGSATTSYTADVAGGTDITRVTAVASHSRAQIRINGMMVGSGQPSDPIDLAVGNTNINVEVTAENGNVKTYRTIVTRPVPNDDASLDDLTISAGDLDQIFDPDLLGYTASVGHLAASTRVVAGLGDPLADSLLINGVQFEDSQPSPHEALAVGSTPIDVQVTAEDDVTRRTYRVDVQRADFASLGQRAYIKSIDTGPDRFGFDLALNDDRLLVGAPFEQSLSTGVDGDATDNSLSEVGAAYVYDRIGGIWTPANYLKASNPDSNDWFGWSVEVADGRLLVGAPGEQSLTGAQADNSGGNVGAVYVFEDAGAGTLVQTDYLKASNPDEQDRFGRFLSADSGRILVSAPFEASAADGIDGDQNDNSQVRAGAAYLFEQDSGGSWVQTTYIKASNTDAGDEFGSAVAIDDDAMLIGAWQEDSGAIGIDGDQDNTEQADSGAAYLLTLSEGGWAHAGYFKASNTDAGDGFGFAVSLDGELAAIGAPGEDSGTSDQADNSLVDSGAVYVFSNNGSGWSQEAYLKPSNPDFQDQFGNRVALVGNLLAVGAPGERSSATGINRNQNDESAVNSGAVYLFERTESGAWNQIAYLKASNTDPGDSFGAAVALDRDTLAVGAPMEQSTATGVGGDQTSDGQNDAGAVYLFR
jgi:hypothetical protein